MRNPLKKGLRNEDLTEEKKGHLIPMKPVPLKTPIQIFYTGTAWEEGPCPSVLYFALSAEESLAVIPYAHFTNSLKPFSYRIFSVDLPFHGKGLASKEAMNKWASSLMSGIDITKSFLEDLIESVKILLSSSQIDQAKVAAAGLSRGGFVAAHLTAAFEEINTLACFAPLVDFFSVYEFSSLKKPFPHDHFSLFSLVSLLCKKNIKVWIGGNDTRVHTDINYQWIRALITRANDLGIRSPPIELALKPSIGHAGHGTSNESFEEGALWINAKWHE